MKKKTYKIKNFDKGRMVNITKITLSWYQTNDATIFLTIIYI